MGSATSPPPGIAVTSLRIERDKLDALKALADSNQRTVSQEIRWLIDRRIREHGEPQEAA